MFVLEVFFPVSLKQDMLWRQICPISQNFLQCPALKCTELSHTTSPKHALVDCKWSCIKTVSVQTKWVGYKGLRGQNETWAVTRDHPIKRNSMFILPADVCETILLTQTLINTTAASLTESVTNSISGGTIKLLSFKRTDVHVWTHTNTKTTHPKTETWHL